MAANHLPAQPWLEYGLGWESRRLTPIVEDLDDEVPPRSFGQLMKIVSEAETATQAMDACQQAASAAMKRLQSDNDLRQQFATHGIDHLNVTPAFVDPGWEPNFTSPRFKVRRAKRFLDVDVWYIYKGPIEPEAFGNWVYEHVRADLEAWLQQTSN